MPRPKKEKSVKATKAEPKYLVTLGYNEKQVELKGDSLSQIFLGYEPEPFKSLITIKVKAGKQEVERLWPVVKARRVFRNHNNALIEGTLLERLFN